MIREMTINRLGALALAASLAFAPAGAEAIGPTGPERIDRSDALPDQMIVISINRRTLWLVQGQDTVMKAPIAVGKDGVFEFQGRRYTFNTPPGQRVVRAKTTDPWWTPPDWHYFEKAVRYDLEPVHLEENDKHELSDGTFIEVREGHVGRVNRWGNWWPFTPGSEIVFDGKIFVPPMTSPQRRIPNALGPVKLDLGEGYLIHGTHPYNTGSIGLAASHGCIRMNNEDVERLYAVVPVGTRVMILPD